MKLRFYFTGTLFALLFLLPARSAFAFGGGGGGCGAGACAECHSFEKSEAESLLKGLVDKVHSVDFAAVPGLWEAVIEAKGKQGRVYIDFSKSYLITGRVLRLSDWTEVVGGKAMGARNVDPSKLTPEGSIILGNSVAAKKVYVFTDPQCPYCRQIHEEFKKVIAARKDVAFVMKFFPLSSHPDSPRLSKSIICSSSLSMLEDALADRPVPDPTCDTDAIDKSTALANSLGIRSTPTMILPDGRVVSGFRTAEKILEMIDTPPGDAGPQ